MAANSLELVKLVNGARISIGKVSNGLPFHTFRCSRKFSTGTTRRVVFHLLSNRYFRNLLVNGKRPIFSPKLVPLRSLRSSFIDSFSCNTSEGFGAFFVQSCDQFLFPCYLFISFLIFSLFLNFITIIIVEFLLKLTILPQKNGLFLRGARLL